MFAAMRRPFIALAAAIVAIGVLTGGLAWLLDTPKPPPGADRAQRLYFAFCADCHGRDGHGSWRAALFLVRPGDLTKTRASEQYIADIVKSGGAPIGRPGMPAFGSRLSDDDVAHLAAFVKSLGTRD